MPNRLALSTGPKAAMFVKPHSLMTEGPAKAAAVMS